MPSKFGRLVLNELEQMHTGSPMARRRALLACEECLELSDRDDGYEVEAGSIEFKQTVDWVKAYDDLKSVLDTREHWKAPR